MKIGLWVESPGLRNKLNEGSAAAQFALNMSESIGTLRLKTHLNINRPIYIYIYIYMFVEHSTLFLKTGMQLRFSPRVEPSLDFTAVYTVQRKCASTCVILLTHSLPAI